MSLFGRQRQDHTDEDFDHSGYVDVHCHILPGVDDGAQIIDDSLALAEEAVANGVTDVVATPHLKPELFPFSMNACQKAFKHLRNALAENDIPLTVHFGAEVQAEPGIIQGLQDKSVPTLGGGQYVLLEFPFEIIPAFAQDLVFEMQLAGFKPVLAHPERNRRFQENINLLGPFMEAGCLTQLNSTSLTGHLGKAARVTAFEVLEKGWGHMIASDAHTAGDRGPNFKNAVMLAAKYIGVEAAHKLVRDNPAKTLKPRD